MLRRSGPRSPTRWPWPTNSSSVARAHPGGERLALGRWLEERLGAGAAGSSGGRHGPTMVARAVPRPASVRQNGPMPGGARRRPRAASRSAISAAADDRDAPDVAGDVGVFLGGRRRRSSRPRGRIGGVGRSPAALAARACGRLGRALLGDDLGLELGGAGLFLGRQRRRRRAPGLGRRSPVAAAPAGWARRAALEAGALAGSDGAAACALGHDVGGASRGRSVVTARPRGRRGRGSASGERIAPSRSPSDGRRCVPASARC